MPVESATYIPDLVSSNPPASDGISQGDDHLRLIKAVLKATLPNFTAAPLASTQAQIDAATALVTNGNTVLPDAGAFFKSDSDTGIKTNAANELDLQVGGVVGVKVTKSGSQANTELTGDVTADGKVTAATGGFFGPGSVPIGGGCLWFSDTLPDDANWAWANGQEINRITYATCFAKLGTAYGPGDGTNTFNLPDLRDNVPVGKNTMGGTTAVGRITTGVTGGIADTLGKQLGEDQHLLISPDEIPSHKHTLTDPGHHHTMAIFAGTGDTAVANGDFLANLNLGSTAGYKATASGPSFKLNDAAISTENTGITMANTGTGGKHNNVQPSMVCNWIIRIA